MDESALRKLLEQVRDSHFSPEEAITRLRHLPFEDLGFAKIDPVFCDVRPFLRRVPFESHRQE